MRFPTCAGPVRVTIANDEELHAAVAARLARGEGFALATLNLDHLVKLQRDQAFAEAYRAQDFVTADGNPVVWCCHRAGQDGVSLMPGSDAILPLARMACAAKRPIGLLGSTDAALGAAAQALERAVPGLEIACRIAPPMGFDPGGAEAADHLRDLEAAGVGLCFLALGAPKQEVLAARGRNLAPGVGFASIGAGLDFLAGRQSRAPEWIRRLALEWLWRLTSDPRRLARRYLHSALILPRLWIDAGRQRRARRS